MNTLHKVHHYAIQIQLHNVKAPGKNTSKTTSITSPPKSQTSPSKTCRPAQLITHTTTPYLFVPSQLSMATWNSSFCAPNIQHQQMWPGRQWEMYLKLERNPLGIYHGMYAPFFFFFVSLSTFPHDAYICIPWDAHILYSHLPLFTISYIYSLAWHPPIPQL